MEAEVEIAYDVKKGRIVLSGLSQKMVKEIQGKLDGAGDGMIQVIGEGFVISQEGVFMQKSEASVRPIGYG